MRILIIGATGTVGGELVRQLLGDDVSIRAVTRKPADAHVPGDVEVVFGDADRPESITVAADGVDAAFVMTAGTGSGALLALRGAGVRRVVYMSALTVQTRPGFPIGAGHEQAERDLRSRRPVSTVLRPGQFASNTLWWRGMIRSGQVFAPFPDVATPMIDPYDIAAVARTVLLAPDGRHAGATYPLTGPELITARQRVDTLARVLQRHLELVPIERSTARAQMRLPEPLAEAALDLTGSPNAAEREIRPTVEQILDRPARTFADWAEHNKHLFA